MQPFDASGAWGTVAGERGDAPRDKSGIGDTGIRLSGRDGRSQTTTMALYSPSVWGKTRGTPGPKVRVMCSRCGPTRGWRSTCAFGSPDDIIMRIEDYVRAGATKFVLRAACPPEETLAQIERLAREVIPAVHQLRV